MSWKRRFGEYRHSVEFRRGDKLGQTGFRDICLKIIKIYEQCVYISLHLDPQKGNLAWVEFSHHFERMIDFTEDVIDSGRRLNIYEAFPVKALMSMIPNLGDLLQVTCSIVRDRSILDRAFVLLKNFEYRSGFFGSAFVARLLETKARTEQTGWYEAPIEGGCDCIQEAFICSFHQVDCITASEERCSIAGYVAVTMTTRQDTEQGIWGRRHVVPCFGDSDVDNFR